MKYYFKIFLLAESNIPWQKQMAVPVLVDIFVEEIEIVHNNSYTCLQGWKL